MLEALRKFLKGLGPLKGKAVLAAVSGGADSVCLLLLLAELRGNFGYRLEALHCNHGLRGRQSDGDERFVRALCRAQGLRLRAYRTKLARGRGAEERGRDWRRLCFAKAAKASGAKWIFLAHHAGDQAETLLMNIMRGAGLSGAGAMRPSAPLEGAPKVRLLRPWLESDPKALRAELKRRKQAWREDASNADTDLKRNALRRKVLPQMERLLPGASSRMAAFARRAAEAGDALDALASREVAAAKSGAGWKLNELASKEAWLRRLMLKRIGGKLMDEAAVGRAEALVLKGHGRADLRKKSYLEASRKLLVLRKTKY